VEDGVLGEFCWGGCFGCMMLFCVAIARLGETEKGNGKIGARGQVASGIGEAIGM
jgi:hypothetical protein